MKNRKMQKRSEDDTTCVISRCRNRRDMIYFDVPLCGECFGKHSPKELQEMLGLEEGPDGRLRRPE